MSGSRVYRQTKYVPPPPGVVDMDAEIRRRYWLPWSWIILTFGALFLAIPVIGALGFFVVRPLLGPRNFAQAAPFIMSAMFLLTMYAFLSLVNRMLPLSPRRDFEHALERDFRVCIHCRYDLASLPDDGICPECGREYSLTQNRRSWVWTFRRVMTDREKAAFAVRFPDLFTAESRPAEG